MSDTTRPQRVVSSQPTEAPLDGGAPAPLDGGAPHSAPKADVVGAVAGRPIPGPLKIVKLAERGVEVMLPGNATFQEWAHALQRANVFPDQAAAMSALCKAKTVDVAHDPNDKRPIVGIMISEAKMLSGAHKNTDTLVDLVEKMDCRPVLVPPCADLVVTGGPDARQRAIAALASTLDGIVGPGGADVDPSIYGEQNTDSIGTNVVRDRFEADFTRTALDGELFGFGICRSHQLWNAAAGGSLVQDVQHENVVSVSHKSGEHGLRVKRRSMIYEAVRQESFRVNSFHHQAVDFAGWGFRVVGVVRATLNVLVDEMKKAKAFEHTDFLWAKRELARRLR